MMGKKWLMMVAAIAAVLLLAACGFQQTPAESQPPQSEEPSQSEQLPEEESAPAEEEPATEEEVPTMVIGEETLITAVEEGTLQNYEEYRGYLQQIIFSWGGESWGSVDRESFGICLVLPGLTQLCAQMRAEGLDETQPDWAGLRDAFCEMCVQMQEDAQMFDLPEMTGNIWLLNDYNNEQILLYISDGAVLYDVMADQRITIPPLTEE